MSQQRTPRPSFFTRPEIPVPLGQSTSQSPFQVSAATSAPFPLEVHVGVLVDRDAAVAKGSLMLPGSPYAAPLAVTTGSCKRHQDDEPDDETATLYATARALRKMANRLERQASARVRHADSNRRHKRERKFAGRKAEPGYAGVAVVSEDGAVVTVHAPHGTPEVPQKIRDMAVGCGPGAEVRDSRIGFLGHPGDEEKFRAEAEAGVRRTRPGRHRRDLPFFPPNIEQELREETEDAE